MMNISILADISQRSPDTLSSGGQRLPSRRSPLSDWPAGEGLQVAFGEEGVEQGFDDVLVGVGQALDLLELA
jgi:hypothetical protein